MSHCRSTSAPLRVAAKRSALILTATVFGFAGCVHQQARMQAPEENETSAKDKTSEVKTIRDVASFANTDPIQVSGVGLVVGLEGTGGDPPPGGYRDMLVNELRKRGVENVKEVLASPNNAMVLVTARIPAGGRKGDPLDVDVLIPPGSKATSLRGGYLKDCPLYNFETSKNLSPNSTGPNRALQGHPVGRAEGPRGEVFCWVSGGPDGLSGLHISAGSWPSIGALSGLLQGAKMEDMRLLLLSLDLCLACAER